MKLNPILFIRVAVATVSVAASFLPATVALANATNSLPPTLVWAVGLAKAQSQSPTFLSRSPEADPAKAEFKNKLSGAQLVTALRKGGYVIFLRHTKTEVDYADQVFARMGYCATQRVLGEAGWRQAREIGRAFQQLKIPVGLVYSSEYCRAWQTADLAFGRYKKMPGLNFAPAEEYTDAQVAQMREGILPFLTTPPAAGTNTILVGHDDVFEAATEIYPEPQGVAFVVQPDGAGKFEVIARIPPDQWLQLNR
jgi:phosphohistidine phosphatase SixA